MRDVVHRLHLHRVMLHDGDVVLHHLLVACFHHNVMLHHGMMLHGSRMAEVMVVVVVTQKRLYLMLRRSEGRSGEQGKCCQAG